MLGLEALEHINKNIIVSQEDIDEDINIIEKELKALENISKAYGDYANHKISEYELIMIVGENTTY